MHPKLVIGLTGGIASGKSTVAKLFAQLGIDIIDADTIARNLTTTAQPHLTQITQRFGPDILKNGELDRAKLKDYIFKEEHHRQWLNELLHPPIRQEIKKQIATAQSPYVIAVIPLLAEAKGMDFIDRILVIDIPESLQLARLISRDHMTPELATKIIQAQASRQHRLSIANDILENTHDLPTLEKKVTQLHQKYLNLAKQK